MKLKFAVGGLLALVVSSLSAWAAEDGSAGNPYLIGSEADLAKITQFGMGAAGVGKHFELTADITLTAKWAGIGTYAKTDPTDYFSGIFDGKGHKISNVVMADNGSGANNYRGFFNQIDGGTVKNLTVATTGFGATPPSGEYGCAAIAGAAYNATIENCVAEGTISGTHNVAGIVVLIKDTSIIGCTNKATITGSYTKVAGICVLNKDSTTACLIDGCVNEGAVTAAGGTDAGRDGIAGIIAYVCDTTLTIRDCANKGVVAKGTGACASARVGQIVGYNYKGVKAFEGTITGTADVRMVGDVYGNAIDRHLATVSAGVAAFIADADVVAGKSYKAMATGGTVTLAAAGTGIAIDTSLATVTVTTTATDAELVQEGDYYALVKVTDITDVVRLAGKGETELTKGTQAVAGKYSVANAFGKTIGKDSRVLLKEQANDIVWTIAEDFCPGEEFIVSSYTLRRLYYAESDKSWDNTLSRQRAPASFALEGTVDGKTWVTIDEQTVSWGDPDEMEKSFTVAEANRGSYRIYRFRIRATNSENADAKCGFQYVALRGQVGGAVNFDEAVLPGNVATIIDDFELTADCKIEFDLSFNSVTKNQGLFANAHSDDSTRFRLLLTSTGWTFNYGTRTETSSVMPSVNTRYTLVVDGPVVTLDGNELCNAGTKLSDPGTRAPILFATHNTKQYPNSPANFADVKVYGVKIWDAAGNLKFELHPGVSAQGVRALLADRRGIRSYASTNFTNQIRNDFSIHPMEKDLVEAGAKPVVSLGANTTLKVGTLDDFFTTDPDSGKRFLLVEEATAVKFDIPEDYEPGKPVVLTRFVIVPCVAADDGNLLVSAERCPALFKLQASADGEVWTTLYEQGEKFTRAHYLQGDKIKLSSTSNIYGYMGVSFEIPEANRGDYRHYRLVTTATNRTATDTGSRWGVQGVRIFGVVGEPSYDPIEYVQNGTDEKNKNVTYFKTGVQPSQADMAAMTIEIRGEFTKTDQTGCLFCARGANSANTWTLFLLNGALRLDCKTGSSSTSAFKPDPDTDYKIIVIGNKLYVYDTNGTQLFTYTSGSTDFKPGSEIVLMASHNALSGWDNQGCFKLKSCRIIDAAGHVLRDYVPVGDAENGTGYLLDRVSGDLRVSDGTAFRTGDAVETDIDFRRRGRAVTLATELVDGALPRGPLTFAFEGNQILQGTLYAAFDNGFVGTDMDDWAEAVELGTLKNGVATMTVDKLKVPNRYPCVKFFVRDDLGGASYTRSYGTGIRGTTIIIR